MYVEQLAWVGYQQIIWRRVFPASLASKVWRATEGKTQRINFPARSFAMPKNVTITVLRTSDAKKSEVSVPLSASLREFGELVDADSTCRFFHLGRELKSRKRSLASLGIGKYDNYLIHLKSTSKAEGACDLGRNSKGGTRNEGDAIVVVDTPDQPANKRRRDGADAAVAVPQQPQGDVDGVIDLLDDSDSNDDDDSAVIVEEPTQAAKAASRKRRRL